LKSSRLDLSIGQEVHEKLNVEVGDTNVAGKTIGNKLLNFSPALVHGSTVKGDLVLTRLEPARGVSSLDGNVLQGNGDYKTDCQSKPNQLTDPCKIHLLTVNQVEINIFKVEVLELLVEGFTDVLLLVIGVPQLGGD